MKIARKEWMLIAVLVCAPLAAEAEIYRCISSGKQVFTDKPCEALGYSTRASQENGVTNGPSSGNPANPAPRPTGSRAEIAARAVAEFGSGSPATQSKFAKTCMPARYETWLAIQKPNPTRAESMEEMKEIERICAESEAQAASSALKREQAAKNPHRS